MKKTLSALTLALALSSAVLLSACSGSKPVTLDSLASSARAEMQSSAQAAASSAKESPVTPDLPSYPVGPAGNTLRVWTSSTTFADVTVTEPTFLDDNSGVARVGVEVKATQGPIGWISDFSVINQAGTRVNQWGSLAVDRAGLTKAALDSNSALVPGEVRSGFVYFSASDVSKIYLGADNGTKAMWTV